MHLIRFTHGDTIRVGLLEHGQCIPLDLASRSVDSLTDLLDLEDPSLVVRELADAATERFALEETALKKPLERQEVWAAGVTYLRSKAARMEESEAAASCYDQVYDADRPEIFFKATPHRTVGPGELIRIRSDATWNVPEPELGLVLNRRGEIVGYTVGNDVSSRDIEGDNPLYLPQAKCYDACCAVGPCIALAGWVSRPAELGVRLLVERGETTVFSGETSVAQMKRSFDELVGWLLRDNSFPDGAVLLTGAGVVPDSDFTLRPGDVVRIAIDSIGELRNAVVQGG